MNDDRAAEGLDHLQTAALEMIQAARAFLDVAEDLVADRDKVAEVVSAFGSVADAATRAARGHAPRTDQRAEHGHEPPGANDGVQHIKVS
jgi:hypothetical protein